jgi:hypothetical protein
MLCLGEGEDCPFAFNLDSATYKVGDTVSYRGMREDRLVVDAREFGASNREFLDFPAPSS